jgi:hypothetical protein
MTFSTVKRYTRELEVAALSGPWKVEEIGAALPSSGLFPDIYKNATIRIQNLTEMIFSVIKRYTEELELIG